METIRGYTTHAHCLVPAGGVSAHQTEWWPARTSSLGPVQALERRFRGLFLDPVRQERPDLPLPEVVWTKGWVVNCKPTAHGMEQVLQYLGRYVHRIALTNHRLRSIADGQVCFRDQDSQDQRWQTMTLVKGWQQMFLGLQDVVVLRASEKPEPGRDDG